jgi:hypothetical protein
MASKRAMRRRVWVAALVLVGVLVGTLAGCGEDDKDVAAGAGSGDGSSTPAASVKAPTGQPSVVGTATKVTAGASCPDPATSGDDGVVSSNDASASCASTPDGSVTLLVRDGKDPSGAALAASIRVPASASVLRTSGSGYTKASAADLRDGATVKVWFTGPVAESYPVQATAGTVVITG